MKKYFISIVIALISFALYNSENITKSIYTDLYTSTNKFNNKSSNQNIETNTYIYKDCDKILKRELYQVCYNYFSRSPVYSFYILTPEIVNGKFKRQNDFREDEEIPKNIRRTLNDFKYEKEYDRGHLYPAGSADITENGLSETFLLSNIIPQYYTLNRGVWAELEGKVRDLVNKNSEVHVYTGPIYTSNIYNQHHILIPDYLYKVLYIPSENKFYAFLFLNNGDVQDISSHTYTVDDIEKVLSIDFFHYLDKNIQQKESIKNEL